MLFNSHTFLFEYLPIVFLVYFFLCRQHWVQGAKLWLFLSSLFFYGFWDVRFLPLLLGSILFNFFCGNCILKFHGTSKKCMLALGVIANLCLLFYFKYANFFLTNVVGSIQSFENLILPLGISFFTFTQLAYLVDASRQEAGQCGLISYGLFVTVFPHLIAGPILHHKPMIKQFEDLRMYVFRYSNVSQGAFLFILGLSKKVLIADTLSALVNPIFDTHLETIPFVQGWFGAFAYTLQLYFDFSGYSDMAVGLGLLFNLKLPINFNSPYKADSIIDFWRRWHMTLSAFLKDYLYIPLGGSRNGKFNQMRNLLLTMLLGGLWHGAGWTFVIWGALHGSCLVINHLWRELNIPLPRLVSKSLMLFVVIVAWVIFRAPDLTTATRILEGMFGFNGVGLPPRYENALYFLKYFGVFFQDNLKINVRVSEACLVFAILIISLLTPNTNQWLLKFKQKPNKWAIPCAGLFVSCFLCLDDVAEFLYYQF